MLNVADTSDAVASKKHGNRDFPAYLFVALLTFAALTSLMVRTQPTLPWLMLIVESAILSVLLSPLRFWKIPIFILLNFSLSMQAVSIYQTGEFISKIAIANTGEYHALGKTSLVTLLIVFITIFLFNSVLLAVAGKFRTKFNIKIFIVILYISLIFLHVSPVSSLAMNLIATYREYSFMPKRDLDPRSVRYMKDSYWTDGDTKGISLKGKNVIVIFTEGLSSQIIDINNGLGLKLTENLDKLTKSSVVFDNYFNHTAATYRGLRGQMTSFYQYRDAALPDPSFGFQQNMSMSDVDKVFNGRLISLPIALKRGGYNSYFLSSTPTDSKLNRMLAYMGFDKVYGMGDFYDEDNRMSDQQTFTALQKLTITLSDSNDDFFVGVYPSGTHLGMNSYDLKYGDGSNDLLNQFYNFDQYLGSFLNWLNGSQYAKNTVVIITADHATFPSPKYKESFSSKADTFVDRIPFIFFNEDIKPQIIDAKNFNSLSFAPTLLHLLGIEKGFNFFIGCSLFSDACDSAYSHISAIGEDIIDTSSGTPMTMLDPTYLEEVYVMYDVGG